VKCSGSAARFAAAARTSIAFTADPWTVRDGLAHLGDPAAPPRIAPGPALLTPRGHSGVGTRAEVRRNARETPYCRRKSRLILPHPPDQDQVHAIELPIRDAEVNENRSSCDQAP